MTQEISVAGQNQTIETKAVGAEETEKVLSPEQMIYFVKEKMLKNPAILGVTKKPGEDDGVVEWINFLPEGGIQTKLSNFREPYRGFPPIDFVEGLDAVKKFLKFFLKRLYEVFSKRNKLILLLQYLIIRKDIGTILEGAINGVYEGIKKFELKPEMYSQSVREVQRVFDIQSAKSLEKVKAILEKTKLFIIFLLEFDNAYRYRFQDLFLEFGLMDKTGDAIIDLDKLLDIYRQREVGSLRKRDCLVFKKFVLLYLKRNKKVKKIVEEMIYSIKTEEIKFSKEDICFCEGRTDYKFGFMQKIGWYSGELLKKNMDYILSKAPVIEGLKKEIGELKILVQQPIQIIQAPEAINSGQKRASEPLSAESGINARLTGSTLNVSTQSTLGVSQQF